MNKMPLVYLFAAHINKEASRKDTTQKHRRGRELKVDLDA